MLLDTRCGVGFVVGSKAVFKSDFGIISNKKVVNEWLDQPEISEARVDRKRHCQHIRFIFHSLADQEIMFILMVFNRILIPPPHCVGVNQPPHINEAMVRLGP